MSSSIVRHLFPAEAGVADEQFHVSTGLVLGHFALQGRIRSGGMGAVFRAIDTRLDRQVALKVLPPTHARDPAVVQRFKNEARAAAQLDHENVARVFFVGEDQGLHFIAFEFISGTNVRELIQLQGRLQVADAVNYTLQIAGALVHTAAQGIIHRDIKPSNIIITPLGRAKLVDLGLARKESRDEHEPDLTVAGTTLGTFDYISPEQARDPRNADVRSDIYSLGCTLYHMLTGEPPYPEGTVLQKLLQHQGDDAPNPTLKNRHVPEPLSAITRKMMAKDLRRRYHSPDHLVRDLMLVAGSLGLRSISPEGMIWMSSAGAQRSFWERHLAWIGTVAALLVIVAYLEFGGSLRPSINRGLPSGATAAASFTPDSPSLVGAPNVSTPAVALVAATRESGPSTNLLPRDVRGELRPEATSLIQRPGTVPGAEIHTPVEATAAASSPLLPAKAPLASPSLEGASAAAVSPSDVSSAGSSPIARPESRPREPVPRGSTDDVNPVREELFAVLAADGSTADVFPSLSAACAGAPDGAVIELRFNGRRGESPLRIAKRLTLRAGQGWRPTLEFTPPTSPADGEQSQFLSVTEKSLEISGVDLVMNIDSTASADLWSLFRLEQPDEVRLNNVCITVRNRFQQPACIFAVHAGPGAGDPDLDMIPPSSPPTRIEVSESIIRGETRLLVMQAAQPLSLALRESLVAIRGPFLDESGLMDSAIKNAEVDVRVDHVTMALGGSFVRLESGETPRWLLPVQVNAAHTWFLTIGNSREALVDIRANTMSEDVRGLLTWTGRRNIYDRIEGLWTFGVSGSDLTETLDAAAWQRVWGSSGESDSRFELPNAPRAWAGKGLTELAPSDFLPDAASAVMGAGRSAPDCGANLSALSKLAPPPSVAP